MTSANFDHLADHPASYPADLGRLEGIIRCAMEAIITIDESQRVLIFNPMAEKLFGCSAAEAIGGTLERFIPARFRPGHGDKVRQFGVTDASDRQLGRQRPLFGLRANGEEFPIEASISQFVDHKGHLFTVMLRDVTDRLKAEAELNASRNELRALSANLQTAREEEKARIARELHDDLGQRLTALKMDLALLESELRSGAQGALNADTDKRIGADKVESAIENACDRMGEASDKDLNDSGHRRIRAMHALLDDTVQAVRRIAADLRPVMLDDLGLLAAIEWLANEWRSRFGIIVTLEADAEAWDAVSPHAATAIFRIVQESLTNIARHANATRATVQLSRTGSAADTPRCILRISDNGTGQPLAAAAAAPSPSPSAVEGTVPRQPLGLIGMRERARMLEGTLTIEPAEEGGFCVHVSIPLAMIDAAHSQRGAPSV